MSAFHQRTLPEHTLSSQFRGSSGAVSRWVLFFAVGAYLTCAVVLAHAQQPPVEPQFPDLATVLPELRR